MSEADFHAWEAEEAPHDFAERVVAAARRGDVVSNGRALDRGVSGEREESRASSRASAGPRALRRRRALYAGAFLAAAAVLLSFWLAALSGDSQGELVATQRVEQRIGGRAVAVLEPGAALRWEADRVAQDGGDVFYRVNPGEGFLVVTPVGTVQVLGTCFRVRVRPADTEHVRVDEERQNMTRDTIKGGVGGALLGAIAIVTVYEGRVWASHGDERFSLTAGEAARLDANGATRLDGLVGADGAWAARDASRAPDHQAAEQGLAGDVADLSRQVQALRTEKTGLQSRLTELDAELERIAAPADPSEREAWEFEEEDWERLAREGAVAFRVPCDQASRPSTKAAERLGLHDDEVERAFSIQQEVNDELWAEVRPICIEVVGSAETADLMGRSPCATVIEKLESERDAQALADALQLVADIRARNAPRPADPSALPPAARLFLALSDATIRRGERMVQAFGPARTRALWREGCTSGGLWGTGR